MHNVTSAFFARRPAWHRVGTTLPEAVDSQTARQVSGLEWEPVMSDLFDSHGRPIKTHRAVLRSDNQNAIGVVGKSWRPITNGSLFEFLDSVVSVGQAKYESAGVLGNGKRVWALLQLPGVSEVSQDDVSLRYVLAANGHDGTLAFSTCATSVRVVCQNTLSYALRRAGAGVGKVYHRSGAQQHLDRAKKLIQTVTSKFEHEAAIDRALARVPVTTADVRAFGKEVLDRIIMKAASDASDASYESRTDGASVLERSLSLASAPSESAAAWRKSEILSDILRRHEREVAAGTAWGAFNAATEYVDHGKDYRNPETRFSSAVLGVGNSQKLQIRQLAVNHFLKS